MYYIRKCLKIKLAYIEGKFHLIKNKLLKLEKFI